MSLSPALSQQLLSGAARVGVDAAPLLPSLGAYLDLLKAWNARVNLTAIRDDAGIIERHFVDSLAVVPAIPVSARCLVDVGSGAGFPGAVIALARPDLDVLLVESIQKKVAFLEAVRRELKLPRLKSTCARAEAVLARPGLPASFDVAVSRASLDLPDWLALGAKFVHPGGLVIGMEGADHHDLPPGAVRQSYPLGPAEMSLVLYRP